MSYVWNVNFYIWKINEFNCEFSLVCFTCHCQCKLKGWFSQEMPIILWDLSQKLNPSYIFAELFSYNILEFCTPTDLRNLFQCLWHFMINGDKGMRIVNITTRFYETLVGYKYYLKYIYNFLYYPLINFLILDYFT